MRVKLLVLKNFRNYSDLTWQPHPKLNIITGDNAQGKTNLLEAVFFCTAGRSFRTSKDREIINWGEEKSFCLARVEKNGSVMEMSAALDVNSGKSFFINGIKKNRGEIFRPCLSISFTPADLDLIRGSPSERRKWIDFELGSFDRKYFFNLEKYERVIYQRNRLLKDFRGNDPGILEPWNEQMVHYGSKIIYARIILLKEIFTYLRNIYSSLTSGKEELSFKYLSTIPLEKGVTEEDIAGIYRSVVRSRLRDEIERRQTLYGPHRDDISFYINSSEVRKFGSRGQQRSVVLTLKLSIMKKFYDDYGEYPVLLLDDVFLELDLNRRNELDNLLRGEAQVFITSNNTFEGQFFGDSGEFRIRGGKIIGGED